MPKRIFDKLTLPARMGITVGASSLFAIVCSLLFALIATLTSDPAANLTVYGEVCFLASMLFCGFLGAKMGDDRKFVCGILSGAAMLLITVLFALIFSTGGILKALIIAALGMFVSAAGAVLGSREVKRKRRR